MSELKPFDEFMDALVHCDTVKVILTGCGESVFETKPIYEGICALANRRSQPANSRFADCHIWEPGDKLDTLSDKCDVLIKAADIKELMRPSNEPLTLDEMNTLDHEPIYVLHTGGKWTMNGWHIATASSYQNHGRCDLEIDNGNTIIDMQNYGKTWLAYRRKPEGSENE